MIHFKQSLHIIAVKFSISKTVYTISHRKMKRRRMVCVQELSACKLNNLIEKTVEFPNILPHRK